MHLESGPRQLSVRVYEQEGLEAYDVASIQVFAYGDRAFPYSLHGPRFYEAFPEFLLELERLGFRHIAFYAGRAHARLLRRVVPGTGWVMEVGEEGMLDGHRLVWVTAQRG